MKIAYMDTGYASIMPLKNYCYYKLLSKKQDQYLTIMKTGTAKER